MRSGLFTIAAVLLTAAQHANAGQECTVETRLTNCLDGVSSGVSGGAGLRTSAVRMAATKASGASQDDHKASHGFRYEGRAAGETVSGWGLWGSLGYNEFDGSPVFGRQITPFDTELVNGLIGADIRFGERIVLGAALGYEDSDTTTVFNAGSIETDGFTITP